jgi:membrane associated rhomboid family serine protease
LIPLRDNVASQRLPFVTCAIIATNVVVFCHEMQLGNGLERFVDAFGLIPARFHHAEDPVARLMPVFTSMFVHGGLLHLLGNMLFLHIFGDNVEDRFGHVRFFVFYLGCGAVAAIAQIAASPHSAMPMVGASGAIAGVTGAYFVLYPRARVSMLVPIFLFWQVIEVPAVLFLLLWFGMQLAYGMVSLGRPETGGVAWWAHVAGFGSGMIAALFLRPRRRLRGVWAH